MGPFCFTPVLNAALDVLMGRPSLTTKEKVHLWVLRKSWGNWYPYAVKGAPGMALPTTETDRPMLDDLLFGGACPFCGKQAGDQIAFPKGFRWHRECLGRAYARDAARLGDDHQKKWASEIFAELGEGE
jgi:hypothetical protein